MEELQMTTVEQELAELFSNSSTDNEKPTENADTNEKTNKTDATDAELEDTQDTDLGDTEEDETVEETDTDTDSDTDGDDSSDDDTGDEDTADADDDTITYEINGKEYKWTQKEFLDMHQSGLRQADYSKKTMELAEERKKWEAEKEQAVQQKQAELDKLIDSAKGFKGTERKSAEEMAKLAQDDPYSYNTLKAQYDAEDQVIAYKQQQEQEEFNKLAQAETEKLVELVPAFKEDFENTYKATIDYMIENGIDENTAKSLVNAPLMKMVYDSMTANKGVTKNKVKIVPKSVSNKKEPTLSASKKRAAAIKKASSIDDVSSLIGLDIS